MRLPLGRAASQSVFEMIDAFLGIVRRPRGGCLIDFHHQALYDGVVDLKQKLRKRHLPAVSMQAAGSLQHSPNF